MENSVEVEGVDIVLKFNSSVLRPTNVSLIGSLLEDMDYELKHNLDQDNEVRIIVYAQRELVKGGGIIAFVDFDVVGNIDSKSELFFMRYEVNETAALGGFKVSDVNGKTIVGKGLNVEVVDLVPKAYALYQNYPNPFNPATKIRYDLPEDSKVTLQIFNLRGQVVETLVSGYELAGKKEISWIYI